MIYFLRWKGYTMDKEKINKMREKITLDELKLKKLEEQIGNISEEEIDKQINEVENSPEDMWASFYQEDEEVSSQFSEGEEARKSQKEKLEEQKQLLEQKRMLEEEMRKEIKELQEILEKEIKQIDQKNTSEKKEVSYMESWAIADPDIAETYKEEVKNNKERLSQIEKQREDLQRIQKTIEPLAKKLQVKEKDIFTIECNAKENAYIIKDESGKETRLEFDAKEIKGMLNYSNLRKTRKEMREQMGLSRVEARKIDPIMYKMLLDYDKVHSTEYCNKYLNAVLEKEDVKDFKAKYDLRGSKDIPEEKLSRRERWNLRRIALRGSSQISKLVDKLKWTKRIAIALGIAGTSGLLLTAANQPIKKQQPSIEKQEIKVKDTQDIEEMIKIGDKVKMEDAKYYANSQLSGAYGEMKEQANKNVYMNMIAVLDKDNNVQKTYIEGSIKDIQEDIKENKIEADKIRCNLGDNKEIGKADKGWVELDTYKNAWKESHKEDIKSKLQEGIAIRIDGQEIKSPAQLDRYIMTGNLQKGIGQAMKEVKETGEKGKTTVVEKTEEDIEK